MTTTRLKSQNTKRFANIGLLALVFVTMLSLLTGTALAHDNGGPADRQSSNVYTFADMDDVGDARLARTDTGVSYNLRTTGLEKGHATSIWWVIFNNPEHCATTPCTVSDLFVPDVDPAVMAGGGNMVGASGNSAYAGHLNEGQITNEHPLLQNGPGLVDARGAEIHLVVRSHGPVIPGLNHAMFNSFEVGCDVNDCADVQFAVFE